MKRKSGKGRKEELLGTLLAVMTAIVSGVAIIVNKFFIVKMDPVLFTTIRAFFIGIGFFVISLFQNKFRMKNLKKFSWKILLIIGFVGGGIAFLLFFTGLKLTTGGRAAFLHKTLPMYITLFAYLFLREKITRKQLFAMLTMLLGTYFILSAKIEPTKMWSNPTLGDLLVISATILWAVENTLAKYAMLNKESNFVVSFARMFFGSLLLFSILVVMDKIDLLFTIPPEHIGYIAVSTGILFCYVLFYYSSLKYINVSKASTILLIAPMISLFLGYAWLDEIILPMQFLGSILILIGTYFIVKVKSERTVFIDE